MAENASLEQLQACGLKDIASQLEFQRLIKEKLQGASSGDTRDFTNRNATLPKTSPEVICSQSASLSMLGAELQRVFFTFRARGLHLQRCQRTWVVSAEFDLELNLLLLFYRQSSFP